MANENPLSVLRPASYNPRSISPTQREALRRSYYRYGDLSGIVFNKKTKNLVGGHQRVDLFRSAKTGVNIDAKPHKDRTGTVAIGHVTVPLAEGGTIRIPYREVIWDGDTEAAANIAANSGGGEFDDVKLGLVLARLEKNRFPIEDVPLDFNDVRKSIRAFEMAQEASARKAAADADDKPAALDYTEAEQKLRRVAWLRLLAEWSDTLAKAMKNPSPTTTLTKGSLAVQFVEALIKGTRINRTATTAYVPHRLFVAGDKHPIPDLFKKAKQNEKILDITIWWGSQGGGPSLDRMLSSTMPIHGHRLPADFPPEIAHALIDEFCKNGGRMLDPCHGWGGRMLGFLLSRRASMYVGYDVDPRTHQGVQAMFNDLAPLARMDKKAKLLLQPFEDSRLPAASFDFALTCPPYYDVEKYLGEKSSWQRYKTFDAWVKGFYNPLIAKTAAALKPGGIFCLKVGDQTYPLVERAIAYAPEAGFKHLETRRQPKPAVTYDNPSEEDKGEAVVVLRRNK